MDALNPAILASLSSSLFLALIYAYFYIEDRELYLRIWTASWGIYALRLFFQLIAELSTRTPLLTLADQLAAWISGVLLLWGTLEFLRKRVSRWVWAAAIGISAWIAVSIGLDFPFEMQTFPSFLILGGIYIGLGILILRSPAIADPGKSLAGWAFVLWGVHKLDYPWLRQVEWFAPWGFLLATLFAFTVAVGVILAYNQRIRSELRQSEARFRTLFEQAPLSYQSIDRNGCILEVNDTWLEMFGYDRPEVIGRDFHSLVVPDQREDFSRKLDQFLAEGEIYGLECEMERKDGSRLVVAANGKISHDVAGRFVQAHFILRDITERRQALQALESKTEQLKKLVGTASYLTESLDLEEVLKRIGQSAKDLARAYGCSLYLLEPDGRTLTPVAALEDYSEEILSTPLDIDSSLTGQAVKARRGLIFNHAFDEPVATHIPGTPDDYDERVIATPLIADNEILGALTLNRLGLDFTPEDLALAETFAAYASTVLKNAQAHARLQREIEDRVLAEQALADSEERYRSLFENSSSVMLLVDPETARICDANPAACEFYGYDKQTLVRKKITDLDTIPPQDALAVREAISQHEGNRFVFQHRLADGTLRNVEVFNSPVKFDGRTYLFSIIHDVTERIQREREMETVVSVAGALRGAQSRAEILSVVVGKTIEHLQANRAGLFSRDPHTGETVVDYILGDSKHRVGERMAPGAGIAGHVIATSQPYLTNNGTNDVHLRIEDRPNAPQALAAVPLIAGNVTIGALLIGRHSFIRETDLRLLTAIGEIAANAIQRAAHFEETQRQLHRLKALHTIDIAITSSSNPDNALDVLLGQITDQLGVDAAAIMLANNGDRQLHFTAGRGFKSDSIRSPIELDGGDGKFTGERLCYLPQLYRDDRTPDRLRRLAKLEKFQAYVGVPLVTHGQRKGILELYSRRQLEESTEWWDFLDNLARQAAIAIDNGELFRDLQSTNHELVAAYEATLEGWAKALELRDKETQGHSRRVTELTLRLAKAVGMSEDELVDVRRGTMLHDIGKMGIPDSILQKPGPLSPEEWEIMRQHPYLAYNLLAPIRFLERALDIPYCHHERWDGSGYPRGLRGEEIPLAARIFALVDVYDALLSDRPYRPAWSEAQVLEYIREQSGKHFDPHVVQVFLDLLEIQADERKIHRNNEKLPGDNLKSG
jgi:PAS domain S-box-containing protein